MGDLDHDIVRAGSIEGHRINVDHSRFAEDDGDGFDGGAGLEVVEGVAVLQPLTKTMVTSMRSHRSRANARRIRETRAFEVWMADLSDFPR